MLYRRRRGIRRISSNTTDDIPSRPVRPRILPPEIDTTGAKYEMHVEKPYAEVDAYTPPAELFGDEKFAVEVSGANLSPRIGPDILIIDEEMRIVSGVRRKSDSRTIVITEVEKPLSP